MRHECGERSAIGLQGFCSERGKNLEFGSVSGDGPGKTLRVAFHPHGGVVREGIFPTSKPEDDKVKMLLPRDVDPVIQDAEIEFTFFWLNLLPSDRDEYCIYMNLCEFWENGMACAAVPADELPNSAPKMR